MTRKFAEIDNVHGHYLNGLIDTVFDRRMQFARVINYGTCCLIGVLCCAFCVLSMSDKHEILQYRLCEGLM